jgi:O-acetyl-ADP-ribose deacetylase (regulator of RNase III)
VNKVDQIGRIALFVVRHSLANIAADALVASDNLLGAMVGHSANALLKKGGREIERDSMATGEHRDGDAWLTKPGGLEAQHVIHVAVNGDEDETTGTTISRAVSESLRVADENNITSIAYPALGTGKSRFDLSESAILSRQAIKERAEAHPRGSVRHVAFVLYSPKRSAEFRRYLAVNSPPPATAAATATRDRPGKLQRIQQWLGEH